MLITSIVMVVVLAVALTTSSLAWFSASQQTVNAQAGSFVAQTQGASNVNIAISKTMGSYSALVNLDRFSTQMRPVALVNNFDFNTNAKFKFNECKIAGAYFDPTKISVSEEIDLDIVNGTEDTAESTNFNYRDTLYLVNYDAVDKLASIKISLESSLGLGEGKTQTAVPVVLLRVSRSTNKGSTWNYVNSVVLVLDKTSGNYTVYDFTTNMGGKSPSTDEVSRDLVSRVKTATSATGEQVTLDEVDNKYKTVQEISFGDSGLDINGNEIAKIDVVIWFDGESLDTTTQGTTGSFSLTITGVAQKNS